MSFKDLVKQLQNEAFNHSFKIITDKITNESLKYFEAQKDYYNNPPKKLRGII